MNPLSHLGGLLRRPLISIALLAMAAIGTLAVVAPQASAVIYIQGTTPGDGISGGDPCHGPGWTGINATGSLNQGEVTVNANSAPGGFCEWVVNNIMNTPGYRAYAFESDNVKNYTDGPGAYAINVQLADAAGSIFWQPYNDGQTHQPSGGFGYSAALNTGNAVKQIHYVPGNINLPVPRWRLAQVGSPRLYPRSLRMANMKIWMDDFQGPVAAPEPNEVGPFNCGGDWSNWNGNTWCPENVLFTFSTYDNGVGRGGSSVTVNGGTVETFGDLANGVWGWGSSPGYPGTGCHNFQAHRAGAGHPTGSSAPSQVCIDQTNPSAPHLFGDSAGANGNWTNSPGAVTVNATANDVGSGIRDFQWAVNGTASGAFAPTTAINTEGQTTVNAFARDGVYRTSPWGPGYTVRIDRTAPNAPAIPTTSVGNPALFSKDPVTITSPAATDAVPGGVNAVSGINPAGYQYRTRNAVLESDLGGVAWSGWQSGQNAVISQGGHTEVQFRATDNAGNAGPAGPSRIAHVDLIAPERPDAVETDAVAEWEDGGNATIQTGTATDNPGGSGISHYEYQVSSDGVFNSSTPVQVGDSLSLTPGSWFVRFRAVDNVGHRSEWGQVANYSWAKRPGIRRSWGEDISQAICQFPTPDGPGGGVACGPGGLDWRKVR